MLLLLNHKTLKNVALVAFSLIVFFGAHIAHVAAAGCTGTGSCFWVGGSGTESTTTHWATASGGATTGGLPSITDDCIFDASSSASAYTFTTANGTTCKSMTFGDPASGHITIAGTGTMTVAGDMTFAAGTTSTTSGDITITATSSITTNGVSLASGLVINASGTVTFKDNYLSTASNGLVLTAGTLDAADSGANHTVTVFLFSSSNSNARTLTMGTGAWTMTGSGTTLFSLLTSTSLTLNGGGATVFGSYAGGTGTRTFSGYGSGGTIGTGYPSLSISTGTDSVALRQSWQNIDFTGFTGTNGGSGDFSVNGNIIFATNMTSTATGAITFFNTSSTATSTITSNGIQIANLITVNTSGTVQLADNLNTTSTATLTLTAGTFDANDKNVSIGKFSSNLSAVRTLTVGSGTWTLTGVGSIWFTTSATNDTYTTPPILNIVNTSTTTKTISAPATRVFGGINVGSSTAGTVVLGSASNFGIVNVSSTGASAVFTWSVTATTFTSIDFTGFTGTWNGSTPGNIIGNLTIAPGMTASSTATLTFNGTSSASSSVITSNGIALLNSITVNTSGTVTLADALNSSSTKTLTLTAGTFNANSQNVTIGAFSSSGSTTRTLTIGSGTWTLTGNNGTVWTTATNTGLTLNKGNPIVANYSGATGTRTFTQAAASSTVVDLNITAGTDSVAITTAANSVNFAGFSGTLTNAARTLYGNLTLATSTTLAGGSSITTFAPPTTASTSVLTSNTATINFPITVNGSGTLQLADALLTTTTSTLRLTAGTFDANNKNVTVGLFSSANSNTRTLTMSSSTWTISGVGTVWDASTATGMTVAPGTSVIQLTDNSASTKTFAGGGLIYNNFWNNTSSTGTLSLTGSNTFNDFKIDAGRTVKFTANTTTTVASFTAIGTVLQPIVIQSVTSSTHNLVKTGGGTVDGEYLSVYNSAASPANTWYAGANFHWVNGGGNTGWLFPPIPIITISASGAGSGTVTTSDSAVSFSYPGATSGSDTLNSGDSTTITTVSTSGQISVMDDGCQSAGGTLTKIGTETSICSITNITTSSTIPVVFIIPTIVGTGGKTVPPPAVVQPPTTIGTDTIGSGTPPKTRITIPEVYSSKTALAPNGCSAYLTTYIKKGAKNDTVSVKKLQAFLTDDAKLATLTQTGIYDAPTLSAVVKFQEWYQDDILAPWNLTKGTGYVYLTTVRKVNLLMCELHPEQYAAPSQPAPAAQPGHTQNTSTVFTRTLQNGSVGDDVKALQIYLNTHGVPVALTGPGSKGSETTKFGLGTAQALTKFQEMHASEILKTTGTIKGNGVFGPRTREYILSHP